jgi:thiamine kinase-like enzyme
MSDQVCTTTDEHKEVEETKADSPACEQLEAKPIRKKPCIHNTEEERKEAIRESRKKYNSRVYATEADKEYRKEYYKKNKEKIKQRAESIPTEKRHEYSEANRRKYYLTKHKTMEGFLPRSYEDYMKNLRDREQRLKRLTSEVSKPAD